MMIEWFFLLPWLGWMALALAGAVNAAGFFGRTRGQESNWAGGLNADKQQSAVVIVAIKGFDADNTARFFEAMRAQRYRRYRLIFTMESADDPAALWLREQLELAAGETRWCDSGSGGEGLIEIQLVIAGPCEGRGQKVHNQIAAFARLRDEDAIVAFADADIRCGDDWLARLLAPINTGTHAVSTTYRYFVPRRPSFVNAVAAVINSSVATSAGREKWNNLWGGSMALARADFDALEVPALFAGSVNDDLRLGRTARRSGRRVAFVNSLLMVSPVDFSWASFFEFGRRQYVQVRFFGPIFYRLSLLLTWSYVVGFVTALTAILGWGSPLGWGVMGFVFLCDQARAISRRRIVRDLFDAKTVAALRGAAWAEHLLTPLWMLVHALLTTSALFTDRIRWAGIEYRILARDRTEVLGRVPPRGTKMGDRR